MNKLNTYKQVARYQQAAFNITFPYMILFFICGVSAQFNANHYNMINLQISIIRPHFILVVYHTEFQLISSEFRSVCRHFYNILCLYDSTDRIGMINSYYIINCHSP